MTAGPPLHFLHVFPGFDPGGSQVRALQIMEMLAARARHSVIALNNRTGCMDTLPAGVRVELLAPPPRASFWRSATAMRNILSQQSPDLVLTYNWGAIETVLGARRAGRLPVVHHEDGFGPEETDRQLRRRCWIRRWLLATAQATVVPSKVLEDIALRTWHLPRRLVNYLPNGVDVQRFRPGRRNSGWVIGHVGRLQREKGQDLLLRAFANLGEPHATLRIYGDGPDAGMLRSMAESTGVAARVDFYGVVTDTAPAYHEMDVFVLSSRTEQMPLTVLEAMASGLPVVSTDVGDVRNMVAAENRPFIVPRGDTTALAGALRQLLDDKDLRQLVGAANRREVEQRFERQQCYRRYVDLYLCASGRG